MRLRFELFGLASGRSWASPADAFTATTITSQYRMALLNRPSGRSLNGILLTLAAGEGETLIPAAVPIALVPLDPDAGSDLGVVRAGDRCFEEYRRCVDRITQRDHARFPA